MRHEFIEVSEVPERVTGYGRGRPRLRGKHQVVFAEAVKTQKAVKYPGNNGEVLHVCARLFAEQLGLTPNCRTVGGDTYVWFTA